MNFKQVLRLLVDSQVEFIVVGGVAATMHGSAMLTTDIDVVYRRTRENMARLAEALRPYEPYLRGAPPGLPFVWDAETLRRGLNFTLVTSLGDIDLLGEITGGGSFDDIQPYSQIMDPFGVECPVIDIPHLISFKRAAGRPKDLQAIAELEAILEEKEQQST